MWYESVFKFPLINKDHTFYTKKEWNVISRFISARNLRISFFFLLIILIPCSILFCYIVLNSDENNFIREWVILNSNNHKIT